LDTEFAESERVTRLGCSVDAASVNFAVFCA